MVTSQPKDYKTMIDAQGRVVPLSYVNTFDRDRDRVARRILARFNKAQNYLARVKAETLDFFPNSLVQIT